MSIALFCKSTGGRRSFSDMRSLRADNTQRTEVVFTFALGGKSYRFRRALFMKKKRGTETYELHDQHECFSLEDGAWKLEASGAAKRLVTPASRRATCAVHTPPIARLMASWRLMRSRSFGTAMACPCASSASSSALVSRRLPAMSRAPSR